MFRIQSIAIHSPTPDLDDWISLECVVCDAWVDASSFTHGEVYVAGTRTGFVICEHCGQKPHEPLIAALQAWADDVLVDETH